ncbi:Bacteriophage HK97-gp10, putative tail-component [Faunimonas pinastri]|uniref:Bacteriophage HK97-gp10, putative tail-component n=1 Tax=Faunimonas pinastri TaxID=1855383 RepID=A0A1H9MQS0_9HYPH|nr:HK97 gp10 family phage protein [Faunimonas pinastri]SER25931.1 Bacteriophage HK97-gp10, putative tail-component [Faunimonas pinastri]
MRAEGFDQLVIALRHAGERVEDKARKTMRRGADKIVKTAQLYAPVDKHNLEDSIHKEIGYERRGRLKIDIVMGGEVNGVNVDRYALLVHENYSSLKPGAGTIAKRMANPGVYIGEKFLERAMADSEAKLKNAMISAVAEEWTLEGGEGDSDDDDED